MNYFSDEELKCKCCGVNGFNEDTLSRLNELREAVGSPIIINSAYRCETHNNHIGATQTHASGQAVDIKIRGKEACRLIGKAISLGFTGSGVKQKGSNRFIHLDDLNESDNRPWIWSY